MKEKRNIEFQGFVDVVDSCGHSLVMNFGNFYEIPRGVSSGKYAMVKPKLDDVQVINL